MRAPPLICTLAASLFAIGLSGQPVPPPHPPSLTPLVSFRQRLTIGDPDRDFTYIHTRDGSLAPMWKLNGVSTPSWQLPAVDLYYDQTFHGGFDLPTGAVVGPLSVDCGRGVETTLQVVAPPVRKAITLASGTAAKSLAAYINPPGGGPGFNDVTLLPGLYTFDQAVNLPANCRVRGYGAVIHRLQTNPIGDKYPVFYIGGQDVSLYGLQFPDVPGGAVLFANPPSSGLVVADCAFKRSNLGFYHTGAFVRDCTFEGGGAIIAPGGLWWRCRFIGPSTQDPWQFWYGVGPCQMVDCFFERTQRGPVFNALAPQFTISDCFFAGVECHDIVRGNNGNECWLCEGGAIGNLLCLHCRLRGCDSSCFQFDGGGSGFLCRDFTMDGGLGIVWAPATGTTIQGCTLQDFQLTRCGFYGGAGVSGCTLQDGRVIDFMPTRGNQTFDNQSPICGNRTVAIWFNGAGANTMLRVPVVGLAPGFTAYQGITQGARP